MPAAASGARWWHSTRKPGKRRCWKTMMKVDSDLKFIGRTKDGVNRYGPSGVPVWSGISADEKRKLVYVTTGNQYTEPKVTRNQTQSSRWKHADRCKALGREPSSRCPGGPRYLRFRMCGIFRRLGEMTCSPVNKEHGGDRDFGASPAAIVETIERPRTGNGCIKGRSALRARSR